MSLGCASISCVSWSPSNFWESCLHSPSRLAAGLGKGRHHVALVILLSPWVISIGVQWWDICEVPQGSRLFILIDESAGWDELGIWCHQDDYDTQPSYSSWSLQTNPNVWKLHRSWWQREVQAQSWQDWVIMNFGAFDLQSWKRLYFPISDWCTTWCLLQCTLHGAALEDQPLVQNMVVWGAMCMEHHCSVGCADCRWASGLSLRCWLQGHGVRPGYL